MVLNVRPLKPSNNQDILNAIRRVASNDYQRRIPTATKGNIQDTIRELTTYEPARNEFLNAFINQIGMVVFRNISWTNPFAKFKIGMLEYGDTIEEVMAGLIEAETYDPNRDYLEKDVFGQSVIDVQSSFHKVNRQDFYKLTINDPVLRQAFQRDWGLQTFITSLMEAPAKSDQWDEFLVMTRLFREYYDNGGFFKVNVPDISAFSSDGADARYFLRRIREFAGTLQFISSHYNPAGMPVAADIDDLELFITPEANAAMDVEALAAAFNIDRANVPMRITIVPKEHFNIEGAQAILTTRDFFVVADQRFETRSQPNPVGLYDNYFLHHWQVASVSRFVPAILFTSTEASDVIEMPETPVTSVSSIVVTDRDGDGVSDVERGELYSVSGWAITTPDGGVNDAIRLELAGAQSPYTYITQSGTMGVGPDEGATSITIRAIAVDDNSFVASKVVTVVGDLLTIWPNPSVTEDDDNDGLFEVVPEEPTFDDPVITIPTVTGVEYRISGSPVTGEVSISVDTTVTAVAVSPYELAPGATASWAFDTEIDD